MASRARLGPKRAPSAAILLALALAAAQALFFGLRAEARELGPGDAGYEFPELEESDFQLFAEALDARKSGRDPASFYGEKKADPLRAAASAVKISMNVLGRIAGGMDQPALEFGPSIVFSREESAIFAKYEARIMESLSGGGSSPMR